MLSLNLPSAEPIIVLCIGAHCDDIEIGCGGALMAIQERFPAATFEWVIFTTEHQREQESRNAAAAIHRGHAPTKIEILKFRTSYLPYQGAEVKDHFERLKKRVQPQLILTHCLDDRHQDHRLIAELTWNTFRNHLVLEYEIPKYEGDLGHPNFFVPLTDTIVARKLDMLMSCFPSQQTRSWFSRDLFQAHLRMRGIECNAPSGFAEAFHARKITL